VWTWRGLVTYYTLFVIDLASRRVHLAGPTRHPDDAFMRQAARELTAPLDGFLGGHRVLICDRDSKWSDGFQELFEEVGIHVVQTPYRAPNCNAHAERFVRSIKEECLHRVIPLGERHVRHAIDEFVMHYHHERNHQGIGNELIDGVALAQTGGVVGCRQRLGGFLRYYYRAA
jgi:transposase InsO family protein